MASPEKLRRSSGCEGHGRQGRRALKFLIRLGLLSAWLLFARSTAAWGPAQSQELIAKMAAAYSRVKDYQAHLVITGFGQDSRFTTTQKLLYTFKKPNKLRLDFETPHRGMIIVYPDQDGKVLVSPTPWLPFFTMHLQPSNPNLEISPGQQINQTDLGLLIGNIQHSLTDYFLGDLKVTEDGELITVRVLSDNPFRRGKATRYVFFINKKIWLPVAVEESTAAGVLQRTVAYQDLRLNIGVLNSFFASRMDGAE